MLDIDESNLLALFDNDPADPGFNTLKECLSDPPMGSRAVFDQGFSKATIPCRTCLKNRSICYMRDNADCCRRCQLTQIPRYCSKDLRGAALGPAMAVKYAKRKLRQACDRLEQPSTASVTEDVPVIELSDSNDSYDSGESSLAPSYDGIIREGASRTSLDDFSRAELLATVDGNSNDIGFKTLQAYLAVPPRAKPGYLLNRLPCRNCLNQHTACKKTEDPNTCRRCSRMRYQKCNFNLVGTNPGPNRWKGPVLREALRRF